MPDLAEEGEKVGEGRNNGRADLVVLVREQAQEGRQEIAEQLFRLPPCIVVDLAILQDTDHISHERVDQLGHSFGKVGIVSRRPLPFVKGRARQKLRDDLTEVQKRNHFSLVAGLHLLGHDLGEGVHGRVPDLVFAASRMRPADQGQHQVDHLLVDDEVDIDPAHPFPNDFERCLDHGVVLVAVPSQQILPGLSNLPHVSLANQVLEVVVAPRLVVWPAQHKIGDFVVD